MSPALRWSASLVVLAIWATSPVTLGPVALSARAAGASSAAALREGVAMFSRGRLPEAEAIFLRTAAVAPRDSHAWMWLGVVRYHREDHTRAAAAFEHAVRLQPRNAAALLWWGHALARSGQVEAAEAAFRQVLLSRATPPTHALAQQALRVLRRAPDLAQVDPVEGPAAPAWVVAVESYRSMARHYNPRLRDEEAEAIARALLGYSRYFNVDPRLIVALVVVESGFQPNVRSRMGAIGLGQLMPETARALGVNPDDPGQNLYGTIRYLRGNLDRFGWKNLHLALAAYNAGRGAVERYEGIPPYDETRWYVYNVTSLYRRLLSL
jgi:soluble lytic murein transglycosylase-like protein